MREKDRKRAYRLMREAKRHEVCGYWALFRREVERFFFFFEKAGSFFFFYEKTLGPELA